ncbi:MAG: T9SS type A sorting domain-containing protein, partial [Desulfobacula sp.]|nr:T9SS type A sorting domain-containing protein [Desulfobacula sp.]
IAPNPVKDYARLSFNLQDSHVVQASLYTLTGQKVMEILNESFPKGKKEIAFSTEKLHSGIYLLRIKTSETIYCTKMLKQ